MHGVGQKMRVASRVTSEHGLACSGFGVRPPSLGLVLSNGLCVHTCPGISIYLYIRLYTNAVYTTTTTREIDKETLAREPPRCAPFKILMTPHLYLVSDLISARKKRPIRNLRNFFY